VETVALPESVLLTEISSGATGQVRPFMGAFLITLIGVTLLSGLSLVPSVIGMLLLQQGATRVAGAMFGTLVAGIVLGAFANLVGAQPRRPPGLVLVLGSVNARCRGRRTAR
jgi:hypothetical protein